MKILTRFLLVLATLSVASSGAASDDTYSKALRVFKEAGQSEAYFSKAYGYALFPTVGKGGFVIGGAHGSGRVYAGGNYVGDTSMTQLSVGLQARASASRPARAPRIRQRRMWARVGPREWPYSRSPRVG